MEDNLEKLTNVPVMAQIDPTTLPITLILQLV